MIGLKAMYDWYDAHSLSGNAMILRSILGREPRTLREYFTQLAANTAERNVMNLYYELQFLESVSPKRRRDSSKSALLLIESTFSRV